MLSQDPQITSFYIGNGMFQPDSGAKTRQKPGNQQLTEPTAAGPTPVPPQGLSREPAGKRVEVGAPKAAPTALT